MMEATAIGERTSLRTVTEKNYKQYTDGELMAMVRAGDQDALGEVYDRYSEDLVKTAMQVVGPDYADDVVSQVFVKFAAQPPKFILARGGLQAYLRRCCRNKCVDLYRERKKMPEVSLDCPVDHGDGYAQLLQEIPSDVESTLVALVKQVQKEEIGKHFPECLEALIVAEPGMGRLEASPESKTHYFLKVAILMLAKWGALVEEKTTSYQLPGVEELSTIYREVFNDGIEFSRKYRIKKRIKKFMQDCMRKKGHS